MPNISLTPDSAECFVFTYKEGLLSAVAHDLKIRVTDFSIAIDEEARSVVAHFASNSLKVVGAMSQDGRESPGALSADQKREIEANIRRDVLASGRYPKIAFRSAEITERGDDFVVRGDLTLHGKTQPIDVLVQRERGYVIRARVHQPDFGIRPYSALFGTLKVKAHVDLEILVPESQEHR